MLDPYHQSRRKDTGNCRVKSQLVVLGEHGANASPAVLLLWCLASDLGLLSIKLDRYINLGSDDHTSTPTLYSPSIQVLCKSNLRTITPHQPPWIRRQSLRTSCPQR